MQLPVADRMDDMILPCSFAVSFPDVFDVDLQGSFHCICVVATSETFWGWQQLVIWKQEV